MELMSETSREHWMGTMLEFKRLLWSIHQTVTNAANKSMRSSNMNKLLKRQNFEEKIINSANEMINFTL